MPTQGDATTSEAQDLYTCVCQAASAADGNGQVADLAGISGPTYVELNNSTAGTATITLEGSFDGVTWYACGYQLVDATAAPARAVTGIAVAGASNHVYQLLDHYPRMRCRQSASASAPSITATIRAIPTS